MYDTLREIADTVMRQTGLRFSDVAQYCEKFTARAQKISNETGMTIVETLQYMIDFHVSEIVIQKKTSQPVAFQLSPATADAILTLIVQNFNMSNLKYSTYRKQKIREAEYSKQAGGKKMTIAHRARHDKAKEVKQTTEDLAAVAGALGIEIKTTSYYLNSEFLY